MSSIKIKSNGSEFFQKIINANKSSSFGIIRNRFDWHNSKRDNCLKFKVEGKMKKKINRSCSFDKETIKDGFELRGRLANYTIRREENSASKRVLGKDNSVWIINLGYVF
jgi:hypothetical protein